MYQRYLHDPNSVDPAWWDFFADYVPRDRPAPAATATASAAGAPARTTIGDAATRAAGAGGGTAVMEAATAGGAAATRVIETPAPEAEPIPSRGDGLAAQAVP